MQTIRSTRIGIYVLAVLMGFAPLVAGAEDAAPDSWVTLKSKIAVWTAVGIPGTDINVDTVHGVVTLHGTVTSHDDKSLAEQATRGIHGAKEVRNLLQVVPPMKKDQIEASDDQIRSQISTAIESDDLLKDGGVYVQSVNKGTVLLAGKAKSLSAHLHALEISRRVGGVRSVHSEITSADARADRAAWREYEMPAAKPTENSGGVKTVLRDLYITSATKMRLLADRETPGLSINVDTTDGVVTLFGTVSSHEVKRMAELDAQKVTGVKEVVNRLEVNSVQ